VFVLAGSVPAGSVVRYYIDDQVVGTESVAPYWLGGQPNGAPAGFDTNRLASGVHALKAVAVVNGCECKSETIQLHVVPSINGQFSSSVGAYKNQLSAQTSDVAEVLALTSTPGASLSKAEEQTRRHILSMYVNWGIDPSLDHDNFQSQKLLDLAPHNWAPPVAAPDGSSAARLFSPDAPFYHQIPEKWPRVPLPSGYIQTVQLNTAQGGDGIGYGLLFSRDDTPVRRVITQWYERVSTHAEYAFPVPEHWESSLPWQTHGDLHMIFVDPVKQSFLSTYKTSADGSHTVRALAAGGITSFNSLADRGGSTAARFAELPVLILPGEATNPDEPIRHALGGPVHRTWMARVFPASGWDYGIQDSKDSCTGQGFTNTGLVPYGGLIQLDPALDLNQLHLSLPAFRILEAIQRYGYYIMDYGCADFDIYTSLSEAELEPFGGLWGNSRGPGVQNEIERILAGATLYVVPPLVKKQ
jgi:hypothetical protein